MEKLINSSAPHHEEKYIENWPSNFLKHKKIQTVFKSAEKETISSV